MIDLNKPLQTREGCPVQLMRGIRGPEPFVLLGAYKKDGVWNLIRWTEEGEFVYDPRCESPMDLVNIPDVVTKTVYLNVYDDDIYTVFLDRKEADRRAGPQRFACVEVPIKVERGHGIK